MPGSSRIVPGIQPHTSLMPRDVVHRAGTIFAAAHAAESGAADSHHISEQHEREKCAASRSVRCNCRKQGAAVATVTELTNRTPPCHGSPQAELPPPQWTPPAERCNRAGPQPSEGIPSALSVWSTDPSGGFEQPIPAKPSLGNPVSLPTG